MIPGKDTEDGNDDHQFNKGESFVARHGTSL